MNIEVRCAYPETLLYANVHSNSRKQSRWLMQSEAHGGHAVIVGGGPSVAGKLNLIRKRQALGQAIFALNGVCRFLNSHGIVPEYQVFMDSNKEMGDRIGAANHYLIASTVAPELLAALPADRVTLWHHALPKLEEYLPDYEEPFNLIGGRATVGLASMCLVYAMGYRFLHLFGYDSSNRDGNDHCYAVPITEERLGDVILNDVEVTYGNKTFRSTLAMTRQAELFPAACNNLLDLGCIITNDSEGLIMAVMEDVNNSNAAIAA